MKIIFLILTLCMFSSCVPIPAFGNSETPAGKQGRQMTGFATWYSVESCRKERWGKLQPIMANGKPLIDTTMTCALPFKPPMDSAGRRVWGRSYRITNVETGLSVIVKHQDFGPGKKARNRSVVCDLTRAAFLALGGKLEEGRVKVKIERAK